MLSFRRDAGPLRGLLLSFEPMVKVIPESGRRRATTSWRAEFRNIVHTVQEIGRLMGSIHIWLRRFGIKSVFPARRGTQKL